MDGRVGYAATFVILFILLSVIFVIMLPMALTFNTALWVNSESIARMGLDEAAGIQNETVRQAVTDIYTQNVDGFNIMQQLIGFLTQFGWVLIPIIIVTIYLLYARQQVETQVV